MGGEEAGVKLNLSLRQKVVLLFRVLLFNVGILKVVRKAKPFKLNQYARDKFSELEWHELFGVKYKRIADSTGEYRFYVPSISDEYAWRVDEVLGIGKNNKLPATLGIIVNRDGTRDESRYVEVWEKGKTFE